MDNDTGTNCYRSLHGVAAREELKAKREKEKREKELKKELEQEVSSGGNNNESNHIESALYMTMTSAVAEMTVSTVLSDDSNRATGN